MARPTISISPDGGRFTEDTAFTITASQPCSIYWSMWPTGEWQHQDNVTEITGAVTQSGFVRFFAIDWNEPSSPNTRYSRRYSRRFLLNGSGRPLLVMDKIGAAGVVENDLLTDKPYWSPVTGHYSPRLIPALNTYGGWADEAFAAHNYTRTPAATFAPAAARWTGDTFGPDQFCIGANNPPQSGQGADQHITVRHNEDGSCYRAGIDFDTSDYPSLASIHLVRVGADGSTATIYGGYLPANGYHGWDWIQHGVQVWGHDPVRFRLFCYVPDDRDPAAWATANLFEESGDFAGTDWDGDGVVDALAPFYATEGAGDNVYHRLPLYWSAPYSRFVVEVSDSSPSQIRSGQPGMLITGASFGIANWIAGEFGVLAITDAPVSSGTAAVAGTRFPGSSVVVTALGRSDWTVSTLTATTWSCDITGLPPGTTTITASSGGESASVTVSVLASAALSATGREVSPHEVAPSLSTGRAFWAPSSSIQLHSGLPGFLRTTVNPTEIPLPPGTVAVGVGTPGFAACVALQAPVTGMPIGIGQPVQDWPEWTMEGLGAALTFKLWDGSQWVSVPRLKVFDGQWWPIPIRFWTGSMWN